MRLTLPARGTPKTRRSTRRPGLSLIEVLLSMAIFFIAIVAISRLVDAGTDNELEGRMHTAAARLAQGKLAEVEAGIVSFDTTGGEFGDADAGWSWSMTSESQVTNLYLVTVTVTRDLKGRPFSLSLSQMILDPSVKGVAAEATRPTSGGTSP